jgi:hypothetical protein
MRAAFNDAKGTVSRRHIVKDPHAFISIRRAQRAVTFRCRVHQIERRRVDNPQHRLAVIDKRDIDCELSIPADEFLRAIERIDKPELTPLFSLLILWNCRFFGDYGHERIPLSEIVYNRAFGRSIG